MPNAKKKPSAIKKTSKGLLQIEGFLSLIDLLKANWVTLLAMLSGGGSFTWATSATDWLNVLGPIAWVFSFCIGAFFILLMKYLWISTKARSLKNKTIEVSLSRGVNPLLSDFKNSSIPVNEFFDPYFRTHHKKKFENCDIYGPATLSFFGCYFNTVSLDACNIVVAKDNAIIKGGIIGFSESIFTNTRIANCTIVVSNAEFANISQHIDVPNMLIHDYKTDVV